MRYAVVMVNGGYEEDYRTELIITRNGTELARHSDRGEPEDNTFGRDWSWVTKELRRAYELGVEDGRKQRVE